MIEALIMGSIEPECGRADEFEVLLRSVIVETLAYIRAADAERLQDRDPHSSTIIEEGKRHPLLVPLSSSARQLEVHLREFLAEKKHGENAEAFQTRVNTLLHYSVNTSYPGFLDKLYGAPLPPGVVAELLLGVLNTNLHVYQVSPVLTLIEKNVSKRLATMFGLDGPRSGGIGVQGGSASNSTSIVIARNTLFPETKVNGNAAVRGRLLLFTSAHGHYSIEKAAQALGFGSANVVLVPVDFEGRMIPHELDRLVGEAKTRGDEPFYVNATAGTTVLGSFDPFADIAKIAQKHKLWLHVDGAWGGGFVLSGRKENNEKLAGIEMADSVAINPHKMLGTPVTCSFLLAKDLKQFQTANTLKAGYLFHDEVGDDETIEARDVSHNCATNGQTDDDEAWEEPNDLADLTLQCGRRGDSLKLFLCWQYYGTQGYRDMVDNAYDTACYLSALVDRSEHLTPVLARGRTPSCLQVCFYFTPNRKFCYEYGTEHVDGDVRAKSALSALRTGKLNTRVTSDIVKALIPKGFMIDFAPALEGQEQYGSFFRVVVNISTIRETTHRLVDELVQIGLNQRVTDQN